MRYYGCFRRVGQLNPPSDSVLALSYNTAITAILELCKRNWGIVNAGGREYVILLPLETAEDGEVAIFRVEGDDKDET